MSRALLLVLIALLAPLPSGAAPQGRVEAAELGQRLSRIAAELEEVRGAGRVPGMAVAVVVGDELVLCQGFGLADVAKRRKASATTLFSIGSSAKSFTATLAAMLVDEGRMGWDDPVQRHLSWFRLGGEGGGGVTIRDLFLHRTGLASQPYAWYGHGLTREGVVRTACSAELLSPPRSRWRYNNPMVVAAGEASARAAGEGWDELLAERLFGPLGMERTTSRHEAAAGDRELAVGYYLDGVHREPRPRPLADLDHVAPAMGIFSTARDMAQWLRFQLGRGELRGRRLVGAERHRETWTAQIDAGGGDGYGLGWMLREWRGRELVHHGGDVDGFSCEVALLPEEGIGFALLTNLLNGAPRERARDIVFGHLLEGGDSGEPDGTRMDQILPFVGIYTGDFAQHRDGELMFHVRGGRVVIGLPGGERLYLEATGPGRWTSVQPAGIDVSFERKGEGPATAMLLRAGGVTYELLRKGFEVEPEIDPAELERYAGTYRTERGDHEVSVAVRRKRLVLDSPDQVLSLRPPDEEGRWVLRGHDTSWVRFEEDEDGAIRGLFVHQDGEEFHLERVDPAERSLLPPLEEVLARVRKSMGTDRAAEVKSLRATGTARMVHQGIAGPFERLADLREGRGRLRDRFMPADRPELQSVLDGSRSWTTSPIVGLWADSPDDVELARLEHPLLWAADWREAFDKVVLESAAHLDGEPAYVLGLMTHGGSKVRVWVGRESGLLLARQKLPGDARTATPGPLVRLRDYRGVAGLALAFRIESSDPAVGRTDVQLEEVEVNPELPQDAFTPPAGPAPAGGR